MHYSKNKNKNKSATIYRINKQLMIEEIKNDEMNNECFDCGSQNPEYISINNGIFLCKRCIYYHCKFPDEISTLIKNNLNNLGQKELNYLYYGGNRKLTEFLLTNCPKLNQYHPEILYKTDELKYYRYQLSKFVKEKNLEDEKLYLSQENFYHPIYNQRTKNTHKNRTYNRKNKNIIKENDNNNNDNSKDNNYNTINVNVKKKYNYRKIPAKKKK